MPRERPWDRTVKIKPGEKLLLVDGDDELFVTATQRGIEIEDARGGRLFVETRGPAGRQNVALIESHSRRRT